MMLQPFFVRIRRKLAAIGRRTNSLPKAFEQPFRQSIGREQNLPDFSLKGFSVTVPLFFHPFQLAFGLSQFEKLLLEFRDMPIGCCQFRHSRFQPPLQFAQLQIKLLLVPGEFSRLAALHLVKQNDKVTALQSHYIGYRMAQANIRLAAKARFISG